MRGWYIGAAVLFVVGVMFALLDLQSPSIVYWTGDRVVGTSQQGLVDYDYRGRHYTIDNERQSSTATDTEQLAVFVDPDHPGDGKLDSPERWIDLAVLVLWFGAAVVVLIVGSVRTRRRRERMAAARNRS